jgi:hypothetical protein
LATLIDDEMFSHRSFGGSRRVSQFASWSRFKDWQIKQLWMMHFLHQLSFPSHRQMLEKQLLLMLAPPFDIREDGLTLKDGV